MAAEVVILPNVRVDRGSDPRRVLSEIFKGRVGDREIELLLKKLHEAGLTIVPFVTDEIAP